MAAGGDGVRLSSAAHLSALLSTFDSTTTGVTLLRVALNARLTGPAVDGVAALLVLAGTMLLEVEGEQPQVIKPGRLILIPAGRQCHVGPASGAGQAVIGAQHCLTRRDGWLVADATGGKVPALVVSAGRIAGTGPEALSHSIVAALTKCPTGKRVFRMLKEAEAGAGAEGAALASALMNACVILGLRRSIQRAAPDAEHSVARPGIMSRAITGVRSQPGERHTVETMAAAAGMSRSTFVRHFTRSTGSSPAGYVKQVRLEEARMMLDNTDLPIKTVSARAGFLSRSHFSRAFRAAFGVDPTSYRQTDKTGDDE